MTKSRHLSSNHLQPRDDGVLGERLEPELGTPGRQGFDDPADVVADEAELGGAALLLHRSSQRGLSVPGHGVSLVEDDDLERRARTAVGPPAADGLLREVLDLLPNDL